MGIPHVLDSQQAAAATNAVPVTLVSPSQLAAERTLVKPPSRDLEEGVPWLGAEGSPELFQPGFVCVVLFCP